MGEDYSSAWLSTAIGVQWTAQSDVSAGLELISTEPPTALQHAVYALDSLSNELVSPSLTETEISRGFVGEPLMLFPFPMQIFLIPHGNLVVKWDPFGQPKKHSNPAEQPIEPLSAQIEYVLATKDSAERTERTQLLKTFLVIQPEAAPQGMWWQWMQLKDGVPLLIRWDINLGGSFDRGVCLARCGH